MKHVNLHVCHPVDDDDASSGGYSQLDLVWSESVRQLNVIDGTMSGSIDRRWPSGIPRKTDVSSRDDREENDSDLIHASNEDNSSQPTIGDILLWKEREIFSLSLPFFLLEQMRCDVSSS